MSSSESFSGKALLIISAVIFLLFGLAYVVMPQPLMEPVGIKAPPKGITDIRATYGGLQVGIAMFLYWSSLSPSKIESGLRALLFVAASVAICRAIGVVVDSHLGIHIIGFTFEITLAVLAFFALKKRAQVFEAT